MWNRYDIWLKKCFIAGGFLLTVAMAGPAVGIPSLAPPNAAPPVVTAAVVTPADAPQSPVALRDARVPGGSLVIAGGGYVTNEVRERFVELAGGPQARIVVIPASDPQPGDEGRWLDPWRSIGVSSVVFCNARDNPMANTPAFCEPIRQATGVWFSGGSQELLAHRYVDTAVQQALHELLQRNGVIGGCSAGAAILSRVMIEEGEVTPVEARGLDLISNAVVDQHLLRRNRIWRLQQMLELHPQLIGLGIDERTALAVEVRTWRMNVIGESYALVCVPALGAHSARIEVLKPGDDVLLSQLRQQHLAYQAPVDNLPVASALAASVPAASAIGQ